MDAINQSGNDRQARERFQRNVERAPANATDGQGR